MGEVIEKYPPNRTDISHHNLEDGFPFRDVGHVSSLEGNMHLNIFSTYILDIFTFIYAYPVRYVNIICFSTIPQMLVPWVGYGLAPGPCFSYRTLKILQA